MQIETGLQLFARLRQRPDLSAFHKTIFDASLNSKATVEISGNLSSGKTLLLTELVAACILPKQSNAVRIDGLEQCAVLIDNDHHFQVTKLVKLLTERVENNCAEVGVKLAAEEVKKIVGDSLDRLTVMRCFNGEQFALSLIRLQSMLVENDRLCLIAIDGLLAYYWETRESLGVKSKDYYASYILRKLRGHTAPFDVIVVYTRNNEQNSEAKRADFGSKGTTLEKNVDCRICLCRRIDESFVCNVRRAGGKSKVMSYDIADSGICWKQQ